MKKELSFEEHFELLKQELQVDPSLKKGEEAKELINQYGDATYTNGGYVYSDNLDTIAVRDSLRIGTLAHEMRHAWQFKNQKEEGFCFDLPVGKLEIIKYNLFSCISKKELDANIFAFRYCLKKGLKKQAIVHFGYIATMWFFRVVILIVPLLFIYLMIRLYLN